MEELKRLAHLAEHWLEHNEEHGKTYADWQTKTRSEGREDLAVILGEIVQKSTDLDALFDKLIKAV